MKYRVTNEDTRETKIFEAKTYDDFYELIRACGATNEAIVENFTSDNQGWFVVNNVYYACELCNE